MRARIAILWMLGWSVASAGALRVGPTRVDLTAQRPVVALEVQNTNESATLAQIDVFSWAQAGGEDVLIPTTDVIATPLVLSLAPGETRVVRVGLRQTNHEAMEKSYRLFVREVPPAFSTGPGLQFAVRIGVPVFAPPRAARVSAASEFGWRWVPDIEHCMVVQLSNPATRHERVFTAEMLSRDGEVLWRAADPVYVLAGSTRAMRPSVCSPGLKQAVTLRLLTERSGTLNLPVEAPSMVVDANSH